MYLTREKAGQILKLNYGFQSESLTFSITAVLKKKNPDAQELTNQYLDKTQKSLGDDLLTILKDERSRENKDVIEGMFLKNYQTKEISKTYQCIHLDIVHLTIKNTQKIKGYETVYIQENKHHFKEEIILESNKINLTFRKEDKEANFNRVFFDQIASILKDCRPEEKDIEREVKKQLKKQDIKNIKLKDVEVKKASKK